MNEFEYKKRVNQAIDYIQKNIENNLTVEEIADYCCFSKFYFNRMFRAVVNESVYSFIKRRKLETAAFLIRTHVKMSITEIALRVGYSSSNFASAFKEYYGVSASEFRRSNDVPVKDSYIRVAEHIKKMKKLDLSYKMIDSRIEIKKFQKMKLLYERFIGNYYDLSEFWCEFTQKMEKKKIINENTMFIGISYDDPLITDENRCIYDVCINVNENIGTNIHTVEQGYYACYKFHDKTSNMINAFNEIFALWLPYSGYEIEHRFPLEIYHSEMDSQGRMNVDICIPITKARYI